MGAVCVNSSSRKGLCMSLFLRTLSTFMLVSQEMLFTVMNLAAFERHPILLHIHQKKLTDCCFMSYFAELRTIPCS